MEKRKATYTPPTIVEHGRMEQLTRGPWGGALDALFGKNGGFNPSDGRSN